MVVRLKPDRMRSKITASYRPVVKIDRFDLIRQPLRAASFPSRGSLKSTEPVAQSQWLPLHAGRLFSETFGPLLLGAGHSLRHRQCRCHLPLRGRQGAGKKTPPGSAGVSRVRVLLWRFVCFAFQSFQPKKRWNRKPQMVRTMVTVRIISLLASAKGPDT